MEEQRHRIKRQILELKIPERQTTSPFYLELRRIYDQHIIPLIDESCSELSRPNQIHRIERLELDLGRLDPDNLEIDFVSKVRLQLRKKLSDQIQAKENQNNVQKEGSQAGSHVELLEIFAHTGALPWWADSSVRTLLEDAVHDLSRNRPAVLFRLLKKLSQAQKPLQRIVGHFDDDVLSSFFSLEASSLGTSVTSFFATQKAIFNLIKIGKRREGFRDQRLRNMLWEAVLRLHFSPRTQAESSHVFWREVLSSIAPVLRCPVRVLLEDLQGGLSVSATSFEDPVIKILKALFIENQKSADPKRISLQTGDLQERGLREEGLQEKDQEKTPSPSLRDVSDTAEDAVVTCRSNPVYQEIVSVLSDLKESGGFFESVFTALRLLVDQLSHDLLPQFLDQLKFFNPAKKGIPSEDEKMKEALRLMLFEWVSAGSVSESLIKPSLMALADHFPQNTPDFGFSDAEERYVKNAGLVLLWPFLSRFFKQVDLMDKQCFKDRRALHRAVALLQTLVTEEQRPAEYSLTLNRILCGMDLDAVFELDPPISEDEVRECEALLEAVIAQVPILKKMSLRGFRGTFLLREGILSARDGTWLLRVTRTDFDVVLDRFPWSVNWIKLPWMSLPLQVEW